MIFKQNLLAATIVVVGFSAGMVPAVANEIGQVKVLVDYGYSTAPGENRAPIYVRDEVIAESLPNHAFLDAQSSALGSVTVGCVVL